MSDNKDHQNSQQSPHSAEPEDPTEVPFDNPMDDPMHAPDSAESGAQVDAHEDAHEDADEDTHDGASDKDAMAEDPQTSQEAKLREALLRTRAEMDNLEKRTQREMDKARKFMFERVFKDLLPVIDSLDQGLEATGGDAEADEGLALTRKLLLQTLERHGLEVIEPDGELFDPQWHEAMSAQPSEEHPAQTVLMVMQKGYRLNERLLRPARVIISAEVE